MSSGGKYDRMSVYVHDRESVQDKLRRLEIEHTEIKRAEKGEMYQAMMDVAFNHVDEIIYQLHGDGE